MNIIKKIGSALVVLFAIMVVANMVQIATRNSLAEPTEEATANTFKNAFIAGCTEESGERSWCVCAYNSLDNLYADFVTNEARHNRILTEGYSEAEMTAVAPCNYIEES